MIKYIISIVLFLLFFSGIHCQTYQFDRMIIQNRETLKDHMGFPLPPKSNSIYFYDTKTDNVLFITNEEGEKMARIFDYRTHLSHYFKVRYNEGKFFFDYHHTLSYGKKNRKTVRVKTKPVIVVKQVNDSIFDVILFKNNHLKRKDDELVITTKKSDFDYLYFSLDNMNQSIMLHQFRKEIEKWGCCNVISSIKTKYRNGSTFFDKIESVTKTNLEITLPKKLKIEEYRRQ